jgi:hypothetical protein
MPIPNPKGEPKKNFLSECMADSVMVKEFPDEKQRYAVCHSKWKIYGKESKDTVEIDFTEQIIAANLHGVSKRGKGWKKQ